MRIQPKTSDILPKICQKLATTLRVQHGSSVSCALPCPARPLEQPHPVALRESSWNPLEGPEKCIFEKCIFRKCISRKFCKFLAGSFSAVSKRIFARKYAFDSIFQALQDLHTFAPLQSQNFRKKIGLKNQQFSCKFSNNCKCWKICIILPNFKNVS